ncbi:Tautomerase/MIF superfamily [Nemania abortiva]|nr:Tautomerase/MIF superfamily [Nemania abortiva]
MPLVKIHVIRGARTPQQLRELADTIQSVMVARFNAPANDRFQIISQHDREEIITDDYGLGLNRTDSLVIIHIFQQGRSREVKQATFSGLAAALNEQCGLAGDDLVVSVSANTREDWSLGLGRAQFINGDL